MPDTTAPAPTPAAATPDLPPGLSAADAAARLQRDGANALSAPQRRTGWHIAREVLGEPMVLLLLAAGGLYLVLGNRGEALMLLAFVVVTVLITLVQEHRTEQALAALRALSSPHARVRRDGAELRIPGAEVVCGDVLMLTEGDRVAADARLLWASDLQADESLLTGEAMPVPKAVATATATATATAPASPAQPAPDPRAGLVFAGTLLVAGQGVAEVVATGARTEIGHIGTALGEIDSPDSPLRLQTRRLVRLFALLGLGLSVAVVLLYGLLRGDWLAGLLAGITLAMSMLPQEFPLILTVFMAMGAWRLASQRVLARRASTIETLGAATVLCTDKTGTLTLNQMAVAELAVPDGEGMAHWRPPPAGGDGALPPPFAPLLALGGLASEPQAFDPMDQALHRLGAAQLSAAQRHDGWQLVHEYALSPQLLAMTHVWAAPDPATAPQQVAMKGAAEAVLALCQLSPAQQAAVGAAAQTLAGRGLRVLAVAGATWDAAQPWPATPQGFAWTLAGLVALADPLRPGVPEAVRQCRQAGIRVLMVTGDHPVTALAIAGQAGLATPAQALTGTELANLSNKALALRLATAAVFARVMPAQKLRIVQALQAQGEVVAMTGDGVNDAPSLKAAHIGIAMGKRGTDVAREAASLVLLDDDFGAIVGAVRLGRRIYDNLRKAMGFVLAVHVPIAGLSLLPLLLGLPMVLSPVHIAFLELLIDPVCSVVFEAEPDEDDLMQRPPRDPSAPLFSRALIAGSLLQGGVVLAAVWALFAGLLHAGVAEGQARGTTFGALVLCSLALILVNRAASGPLLAGWLRPNRWLWAVLAATLAVLALVLLLAPLRTLFHFQAITWPLAGVALGLAALMLPVLSVAARWRIRRPSRTSGP